MSTPTPAGLVHGSRTQDLEEGDRIVKPSQPALLPLSPSCRAPRWPGPEVTRLPPGPAASNTLLDDTSPRVQVGRSAILSPDGRYRYVLERCSEPAPTRTMALIGLNPSTADGRLDDATTRRVIAFGRANGCGRVLMVNLWAWRSTSPHVLRHVPRPGGTRK